MTPNLLRCAIFKAFKSVSGHSLVDEMSFSFLDCRSGQAFTVGNFMMAIVAEDNEIIVLVVGPIAVNVMFRKNVDSLHAADCTGIVGFQVEEVRCFHSFYA